jgi:hypothetical protein
MGRDALKTGELLLLKLIKKNNMKGKCRYSGRKIGEK